jgi:hypothetical protein
LELSLFRHIYELAQHQRVEAAGTVYLSHESTDLRDDGKEHWRLSSIIFGDAHTVECPVPVGDELTYHVHIPHGGQICMPPSPQDWLILIRNHLSAAFVITREGVYKFWWKEGVENTVMNMSVMEVSKWIQEIEALEKELNQVHMGELSIAEYKKIVSKYHMCMEFRSG